MLSLNKYHSIGKAIVLLCLLFLNNSLQSQNLIKNSGFEKYSNLNCSNVDFDDNSVMPANHIVDYWYTYQSPDYFTTICTSTNTSRGIPINDFGNANTKQGNAYAGLGVYLKHPSLDLQEYIYQQLTTPLKADSIYCSSLFVSYSDRAIIAIKNIGVSFSSNIHTVTPTGYINTIPQLVNNLGFITDTVNWIEIKGCFTAQGGEQYVTIGNFNSNSPTDTIYTKTNHPFPTGSLDISYYYIDSVSLWKNNFPTAIKESIENESFNVYPNPSSDKIKLYNVPPDENPEITLWNIAGEEIQIEKINNYLLDVSTVSEGLYFIHIKTTKGTQTKKILIRR